MKHSYKIMGILFLTLTLVILAACGSVSDNDSSKSDKGDDNKEGVTIKHDGGTTKVAKILNVLLHLNSHLLMH